MIFDLQWTSQKDTSEEPHFSCKHIDYDLRMKKEKLIKRLSWYYPM
jgi:hypothetical protein